MAWARKCNTTTGLFRIIVLYLKLFVDRQPTSLSFERFLGAGQAPAPRPKGGWAGHISEETRRSVSTFADADEVLRFVLYSCR